jgi:hypothetical protein
MLRGLLGSALAGAVLLGAAPAFAQFGGGGCTREMLQTSVDQYLQAQAEADPTKIRTGEWVQYFQDGKEASLLTGIVMTPLKIDFHRSLLDTQSCQSFTEVVVTDPAHPYVLGVALQNRGPGVGQITTLVTDHDKGWLFNAANTLKYSKAEDWSPIPEGQRDSRDALIAAASAYLDLFNDKTVQVPWGSPCARLEGGLYTGKGAPGQATPQDSCNVGVPSGVKITDRRFIVDPELGAVTALVTFGDNQLPDAHTFRIEHGKIRYVHTITVCKTFNCGFKLPEQLQQTASAK